MNFKNKLKHTYDNNQFNRRLVALAVGCIVFFSTFWIDSLDQKIGPKLGRIVFELTHHDQLGQMTYTKQ